MNTLYVCRDKVKKFRDEIYQYVWDKKKGEPIKEFDDVLDALRYAIYNHGKPKPEPVDTKNVIDTYRRLGL